MKKRIGFSLVESLVVMAIIAILFAIATPTFFKALGYSRKSVNESAGSRSEERLRPILDE